MRFSWYHVLVSARHLSVLSYLRSSILQVRFLNKLSKLPTAVLPVSAAQLERFGFLAQQAGAASCYSNVLGNTSSVECSAERRILPYGWKCPHYNLNSLHLVRNLPFVGIQCDVSSAGYSKRVGCVARGDVHRLIVVAIQGTSTFSNPMDFVTNIDIIQRYSSLCGSANKVDGCSIHDGFPVRLKTLPMSSIQLLRQRRKAGNRRELWPQDTVLGGVIAALVGTQLRNEGQIDDIVSYVQGRCISKSALIIHSTLLASRALEVPIYQDIVKAKRAWKETTIEGRTHTTLSHNCLLITGIQSEIITTLSTGLTPILYQL